MTLKGRHKDKDIQVAIEYAQAKGWTLVRGGSHAWGFLYCPESSRDGCRVPIWSTPGSPSTHAKVIRRAVAKCEHVGGEEADHGRS